LDSKRNSALLRNAELFLRLLRRRVSYKVNGALLTLGPSSPGGPGGPVEPCSPWGEKIIDRENQQRAGSNKRACRLDP